MELDTTLPPLPLSQVPEAAAAAERMGFRRIWVTETQRDPFLPCALIAEHTHTIGLGTAVTIAFARSPANLAYTAWDLAQLSQGRFVLGLGTQVKAHIERRFGMPWPASVVGKLREQIGAVQAFWHTWQTGEPLHFRGEYYKLTLMSPFFNPGAIDHPHIPIYVAGVNTGLARLAGETADGFYVHPLHSSRYLKEVLLPAIAKGATQVGRKAEEIKICASTLVSTSAEEEAFTRAQIAFYASTPSYRPVLALHGWEAVGEKLSELAKMGQWSDMPGLVSDEMLNMFSVTAHTADLPAALRERYQGITISLSLYIPFRPGERDAFWDHLLREDAYSASG